MTSNTRTYEEGEIKSLEGLDIIKARPSLFIDGLDADGLHRLVTEAVDNAVDEFRAGHGGEIWVIISDDGSVEVSDAGRGIPLGDHSEYARPIAEILMTRVFAGAKFDSVAYGNSGGLHGVGLKCINAFSTRVELTTKRPPSAQKFVFVDGQLESVEPTSSSESGLSIKFWPDFSAFLGAHLDEERIASRLEDLAYLNPGLKINFQGRARQETYQSETGVSGLLESQGCANVFSAQHRDGDLEVECHLGETPQGDTVTLSYANGIPTVEGGSHLAGAKVGIARAASSYGSRKKIVKESDPPISSSDSGEGCLMVVSIKTPNPPFSSQRKTKISSQEIEAKVAAVVESLFLEWLESSPSRARHAVQRLISSARSRERLRAMKSRLRLQLRAKKNSRPPSLMSGGVSSREIWLAVKYPGWESLAEPGRDLLPMRMKQNPVPQRTSLDKLMRHSDYFNLISALSAGVGNMEDDPEGGFKVENCKYEKIVVTSPSLQTSRLAAAFVLLFMERNFPGLIDSGRVFWSDDAGIRKISLSQSIRGEMETAAGMGDPDLEEVAPRSPGNEDEETQPLLEEEGKSSGY
jgi:DNA gyrase subunit B